jgi:hypothetical protein
MGVNVTKTGSGYLGELKPGWSVNEFATPINPVDTAGGTGNVTYGGGNAIESLMLIGDNATFADDRLGSISGVMRTVNQSGLNVDISQDNRLARFDTDRAIPPLGAGSVPAALDLVDQLTGTVRLTEPVGAFWSLCGHGVGFDSEGVMVTPTESLQKVTWVQAGLDREESFFETENYVNPNSYTVVGGQIYATSVYGSALKTNPASMLTFPHRHACKTVLDGNNWSIYFSGKPNVLSLDWGFWAIFTIDYAAKTISVTGDTNSGGISSPLTGSASLASLDLDEELAIFMDYDGGAGGVTDFRICNTSDYSTVVTFSVTIGTFSPSVGPWMITGNTRALWIRRDNDPNPTVPAEYESPQNFTTLAPLLAAGSPALGFNGNVWAYLQQACTTYGWEISLINDTIVCQPVGGRIFDITNYLPPPTVTPTLTFTGRQVDVVYSKATVSQQTIFYDQIAGVEVFSSTELYNARSDDNRIITVNAGESTKVVVATNNVFPTGLVQPVRTVSFVPGEGTYFVIDSTGLPIVADQWENYGGLVSVALNPNISGGIEVTVLGPREEIPSTTAPYSLAVSDGTNQYGALSIVGAGIVGNSDTLNLLTGADPTKTPQQIATTVNNVFIATVEQAYDAGGWASVDASGPVVSFSLTVPTSSVAEFGVTPGSIVVWQNSSYRVMSSTVGKMGVSLQCVRYVTVNDFDNVWSISTVGDHDAVWSSYECKDQIVYPYKTA